MSQDYTGSAQGLNNFWVFSTKSENFNLSIFDPVFALVSKNIPNLSRGGNAMLLL